MKRRADGARVRRRAGIVIAALCMVTGWHLEAVYVAADAEHQRECELVRALRARPLWPGMLAGGCALVALGVVRGQPTGSGPGLTGGWGLIQLLVSILAGVATGPGVLALLGAVVVALPMLACLGPDGGGT